MSKGLEALENIGNIDLGDNPYKTFEHNKLKNVYNKEFDTIKQALLKQQELENTFADCHICEIQKEFAKYEKLCEESKCDECALGVGDGVCLRKTFERKWKLQKEVVSPNSTNLLMQELDCKDFAELRKYARCGYEKINNTNINFKGSKKVKIEIPKQELMDYNPVKQYLKWEDLEFKENNEYSCFKVKLGDNVYKAFSYFSYVFNSDTVVIRANTQYIFTTQDKQFFNDLHLERVEE